MGRGSPLCGQLREKIVEEFEDNISQRIIARNLGTHQKVSISGSSHSNRIGKKISLAKTTF